MLLNFENMVGKIREIIPKFTSVFAVPLKKYLKHIHAHAQSLLTFSAFHSSFINLLILPLCCFCFT